MTLTDTVVLQKTELGRQAIQQRLPVLPVKLRPALILVDGKRTVADLVPLVQALGGKAALEELLGLGLVELASGVGMAPGGQVNGPATAESTAPPAAEQRWSFPEFQQALAAYFEAQLGPTAQMLVIQIRAASDMRSIKPLLERGLDNLKYFKGAAAVEAFKAEWGPKMPRSG